MHETQLQFRLNVIQARKATKQINLFGFLKNLSLLFKTPGQRK